MTDVDALRYPIGKFQRPEESSASRRTEWIDILRQAPSQFTEATQGLSEAQLDTPYRPQGWTLRQVVHHMPDSHINSFIRFKLALTEDTPTIKPYKEDAWAQLPDSSLPIEVSLQMLASLHQRWVALLESLNEQDWSRCFSHPETGRLTRLDQNLALYSWHSRHHLGHITSLKERMGW